MQLNLLSRTRFKIPEIFRALLTLSLTFLVFYLDLLTRDELVFNVFYFPSILLMTWYAGIRAGGLMTITVMLMWCFGENDIRPLQASPIFWGDAIVHGLTFALVFGMASMIRKKETLLEKKSEELTRSNQALEEFAYKAAHDLQTPLVTILGYAELIEEKFRETPDEETRDFASKILKGCDRMKGFIRDLLEYSKIIRQETIVSPVDFNEVMKGVIENLHFTIAEKNATITFDPLPTLPFNNHLMEMVFQNLIGNAMKYCEQTPMIHIASAPKGKEWLFSVRDNGIGIPADAKERVFVMFEKLATRRKYPGSGIGLATCQKIVERCGGKIWVESEVGKGSTFYFTLPAV